jgi:hypothetical protein
MVNAYVNVSAEAGGPYGYGTNLKALDPKPHHKYVQALTRMSWYTYATPRQILPHVKNPASHEFVQYVKLGLAEKFTNLKGTRVFYKITPKGKELLKKAYGAI